MLIMQIVDGDLNFFLPGGMVRLLVTSERVVFNTWCGRPMAGGAVVAAPREVSNSGPG